MSKKRRDLFSKGSRVGRQGISRLCLPFGQGDSRLGRNCNGRSQEYLRGEVTGTPLGCGRSAGRALAWSLTLSVVWEILANCGVGDPRKSSSLLSVAVHAPCEYP